MRMQQVIPIGMLIFGSSAMAGLVQPSAVEVTLFSGGGGRATGDMVEARYSKNSVEFLGCGVRNIYTVDGSAVRFGFCQAMTANSVNGFCSTEDPFLIEALASISDYSSSRSRGMPQASAPPSAIRRSPSTFPASRRVLGRVSPLAGETGSTCTAIRH